MIDRRWLPIARLFEAIRTNLSPRRRSEKFEQALRRMSFFPVYVYTVENEEMPKNRVLGAEDNNVRLEFNNTCGF